MPTVTRNPKCDIELLILASQSAYRVKQGNKVSRVDYNRMHVGIDQKGYKIIDAIAPVGCGGTGGSSLAATCLEPITGEGPIVVAFRGTKTKADVASDLLIGARGVVERSFRDSAFEFYTKIREKYPNREIVLTGHSLGGHLAQYVATKAYNKASNASDSSLPNVQVRTFNTAPVNTKHGAVFQKHRFLNARFVNYRLSPDIVSDLPMKASYGDIFSFTSKKNFLKAHALNSMLTDLPADIRSQEVGSSTTSEVRHNLMLEQVRGAFKSYQCRVEGQWFSKHRQGFKNLAALRSVEDQILSALTHKNYDQALAYLKKLDGKLSGTASKNIVERLKRNVTIMQESTKKPENTVESIPQDTLKTGLSNDQPNATELDVARTSRAFNSYKERLQIMKASVEPSPEPSLEIESPRLIATK
jgi:hypothetical protein